ncbi:MAG TPA: dihydrofolate reductase family protein [Polyangiales bacterium]
MRKMIAALQMSLDGFAQGSDEMGPEWVDTWTEGLALIPDVDTFVQGAGMYPGYAMFWSAIEAAPTAVPPFSSRPPYESEVAYARRAAATPHYVLSTKLESVAWPPSARVVRDLDALRTLKERSGKNIYVVGGPTFVNSLLEAGLLDELKLIVAPVLLGRGKPMFGALSSHRWLKLDGLEPHKAGRAVLSYRV